MGVLKDFDCSKVKRDQAVEGDSEFTLIRPGMSYCGFCPNRQCRVGNTNVVLNRGPGNHLVNDDIVSGVIRCPACHSPFELQYIALFQCSATVTAHLAQEEKSTFKAEGNEIVKLGARAGAPVFQNGLLTVDVKIARDCAVC